MSKPKIAVITGYGINSDYELAHSFGLAGGDARRVHINDLIAGRPSLGEFDIVAVPGGFSFGDHIASGRIFANKLKNALAEELHRAVDRKIPMIGICNGFQVLVKLGILPGVSSARFEQTATLTYNDSGKYEDRWCHLKAAGLSGSPGDSVSPCIWTRGITRIYLPVRHGEGKFIPGSDEALRALRENGQVCLRYCGPAGEDLGEEKAAYPLNPNGSTDHIAGICSSDGLIFGLMPHPEAHMLATNHPQWQKLGLRGEGVGIRIFRNAVDYVKG